MHKKSHFHRRNKSVEILFFSSNNFTLHRTFAWLCQKIAKNEDELNRLLYRVTLPPVLCFGSLFPKMNFHSSLFPHTHTHQVIKKNYVSFSVQKKCDERQNHRACWAKKKNGQMNGIFMLRLILQIQNIVEGFCSFQFFLCVLHRLIILWGLDVNFVWCSCFLLWEFCVVVWYRLLCVPADTCLNFEVPNEHVEHFEGVWVAFEINRGAYYTFFRRGRCSTEWALHIYCLQFPLFDRFGKWESVRLCMCKEFQVFPKSTKMVRQWLLKNRRTSKLTLIFHGNGLLITFLCVSSC